MDLSQMQIVEINQHIIKKLQQHSIITPEQIQLEEDQIQNLTILTDCLLKETIEYGQVKPMIENNQMSTLGGLNILVDITESLANLSKQIYTPNIQYPVEVYRSFREIYENIENISSTLNEFKSTNEEFLGRKDQLIAQHIKLMENVLFQQPFITSQSQLLAESQVQQQQDNENAAELQQQYQQDQEYIIQLQQQIHLLQETLRRNDDEFTFEIQKYNDTLRQLTRTIQVYELELNKITQYQLKLSDLESRLVRFREEKYRNQIIIDNMAKKIRDFQRSSKGTRTFFSPHSHRY